MGAIWLISLTVFGVSILLARWINKHMARSTRWFVLPIFLIVANEAEFKDFKVSPNLPDWLNYMLVFIYSVLIGGVILCIALEFLNIWGTLAERSSGGKNKSHYENEDFKDMMNVIKSMDRNRQIETLENKIFDLKCKRGHIITTNGWRTGADKLSPSELEHNWKRAEYLDQQIEELQDQLLTLKNR